MHTLRAVTHCNNICQCLAIFWSDDVFERYVPKYYHKTNQNKTRTIFIEMINLHVTYHRPQKPYQFIWPLGPLKKKPCRPVTRLIGGITHHFAQSLSHSSWNLNIPYFVVQYLILLRAFCLRDIGRKPQQGKKCA